NELIARLEEADARFDYQIVHAPNAGASIAETPPDHPLLLASVFDSDKRIDVFARDVDALRIDPPGVNVTIKGSGVAKFEEFLRTGRRQDFSTEEVSNPTSTFDFILPAKEISEWKMVLMPSPVITRKI